jgi:hypothetical protein
MRWLIFVAGAVLSWGAYGVLLHRGQVMLGNPLKALLCVGVAYFLIGVLVPVAALASQGNLAVLQSMASHPPKVAPNPMLFVGFALASIGAGMVLYFRPAA